MPEVTEAEIRSLPEMLTAEHEIARAEAVYLSAASAWHEAIRRVGLLNEPDPEVQQAADDAQAAYVAARDRLEAAKVERDEIRLRLYERRIRELKEQALADALARQDAVRRHENGNGHSRGLLSRLFGRR